MLLLKKIWGSQYSVSIILLCSMLPHIIHSMTADSQNDPYPIFSTWYPYREGMLYRQETDLLKGYAIPSYHNDRVGIAISPFGQRANSAKNENSVEIPNLGDINGRWGMIQLLYGKTPEGKSFPPTLLQARQVLFPNEAPDADIEDAIDLSPDKTCGYFSVPLLYRKYGVRFEFAAQLIRDIGFEIDIGVASISQSVPNTGFTNLTITDSDGICSIAMCGCNNTDLTKKNINEYLMTPVEEIADEIGYDIDDFHQAGVEDVRMYLYWRHAYPINAYRADWPEFLLKPFLKFGGTVPTDKEYHPNKIFAVPFGSKNHPSVGFSGGLNLDFTETIEIGAEAGITHFFEKGFNNFHVPTSEYQSGLYPFATNVCIQPGNNWHFCAQMAAYNFIGRLSTYFQYVMVIHQRDRICLQNCNDKGVFFPEFLEDRSSWRTQLANIAFNYDISPNISLGFLWQAPLQQHNSYRTTTVMFSFCALF